MDMSSQEDQLKKKLQVFLSEMLKLGSVKGFKNFAMYMRGREEMVLSVLNKPQSVSPVAMNKPEDIPVTRKLSKSESFSSTNLPYDQRSLMLSIRSQMILSTHGVKDVGLPPASPSDDESLPTDDRSTLFLIAGYGRYNCPYVWVRSNHERLVKLTGESREKDCPLKLKSTLKWKDNEVNPWDIISELVKLCTYPAPRNPFQVDFSYFSLLPLTEKVLATATMMNMLHKILIHTPDHKQYAGQVFEELQLITKQHFTALESLVKEQGLPALNQKFHQQTGVPSQPARTHGYNQSSSTPAYQTGAAHYPTSQSYQTAGQQYGFGQNAMF